MVPPPAAAPPAEAPAPPASAPAVSRSLRVGAGVGLGVLPAAAPGVTLGGALRRERLSVGIALRFDLPTEARRDVTLRASLVLADVSACGHLRPRGVSPFLCAFVQAGALRGASRGIANAREDASTYVAVGPRLGATLPLAERIAVDDCPPDYACYEVYFNKYCAPRG